VPLIEIVSDPYIRSSAEAYDYLARLKQILEYLSVCDGNMEEGSLRCDANVSVRRIGEQKFGTRTELKNINSFRFVQKAIDYEVNRQIEVIESGGQVVQETRLWNSLEERTVSMRSKEEAHDYRYFPDPDLPPLVADSEWIKTIQQSMPELPESRRERFMKEYALSEYDAGIVNQILEENPKPVQQYRLGKTGNFGFFVGQVMKATGGRANPQTVNEILKKRLAG